jgi:thiamine-monophosphate kinase
MSKPSAEFAFINWLRSQTPAHSRVALGPGDDAAALTLTPGVSCLITTDMLLDGVCFRLEEAGAHQVGRKAMAVNLSDIAAMAGRPVAAFASVALPRTGGTLLARELYLGLREMADGFGVAIAGGDTNSWPGPLAISVTLVGEATGRGPVSRRGAKPGDWILVTGPLGGSIAGKHLAFTPRINEAIELHRLADLHAMIDISDGMAADLNHICEESGCGAVLNARAIPISSAARDAVDARSALEHALTDGEDFELIVVLPPAQAKKLVAEQPVSGITLSHVGECIHEGLWLDIDGLRRSLEPGGYVHELS